MAVEWDGTAGQLTGTADRMLDALLDPALDGAFADAGAAAAPRASGHAPFTGWLVAALRPAAVLGAGRHMEALHDAAAGAIASRLLATTLVGCDVDDAAPGWAEAHRARFGAFSRLLARGEAMPAPMAPDLVVVDAGGADALLARADLTLSPHAVMLRRDADAVPGGAALFLHDGGLDLVPLGDRPPPLVRNLLEIAAEGGERLARLRLRFNAMGERLLLAQAHAEARAQLAPVSERLAAALRESGRRADAARLLADREHELALGADALRARLAAAEAALAAARDDCRTATEARIALQAALTAAEAAARRETQSRADAATHAAREAASRPPASRSWRTRLLAPPRAPAPGFPSSADLARHTPPAEAAPTASAPAPDQLALAEPAPEAKNGDPAPDASPRAPLQFAPAAQEPAPGPSRGDQAWGDLSRAPFTVLFVAGEPGGPGETLRVAQQADAGARAGWRVRRAGLAAVGPATVADVDMLVLWRAAWSDHVRTMIELCRARGAAIVFDVDDLVIDPALATPAVIDGMRTAGIADGELAPYFERLRATAAASDLAVATTGALARHLRAAGVPAIVVPNGYDAARLRASRLARRARAVATPPGEMRVRIGYAGGTRTHQGDFATCAGALARLMRARPEVTLVLFRDAAGEPLLAVDAYAELRDVADRIEWRDAVSFEALPEEIARFDVALCPLAAGNPFCETKSEWKYVEAALCSVPCVASPTEPLRCAIRDGETGFLAADEQAWFAALDRLAGDAALRARVGSAAHLDVLWRYGPQRRDEMWASLGRGRTGATARAREWAGALGRERLPRWGLPAVAPTTTIWSHDALRHAAVAVAITCFNYAAFVLEALESVAEQTLDAIELVVVDDCSTDDSVPVIRAWMERNAARFARVRLERTRVNAGLGPARNAAFAAAEAPHVMSLDADNLLRPGCCERLLTLLERERCAFAYSTIPQFGDMQLAISALPYEPARLIPANYIDAMALVAKWAWAAAGGYYDNPEARGWEDYDLWCRLAELGQGGAWHPEPLCDYRVHGGSMTNAVTERERNKRALVDFMEARHPWLEIGSREEALR